MYKMAFRYKIRMSDAHQYTSYAPGQSESTWVVSANVRHTHLTNQKEYQCRSHWRMSGFYVHNYKNSKSDYYDDDLLYRWQHYPTSLKSFILTCYKSKQQYGGVQQETNYDSMFLIIITACLCSVLCREEQNVSCSCQKSTRVYTRNSKSSLASRESVITVHIDKK